MSEKSECSTKPDSLVDDYLIDQWVKTTERLCDGVINGLALYKSTLESSTTSKKTLVNQHQTFDQ